MKRVFIIHGWEADPESNWFPWLANELEKKGIAAVVPAMPNSAHPLCSEWVAYLKKIVGRVDEDTFFVGHSLGPIAILRFLQSLPANEKAGGVIMVAGFSESLGIPETESFFERPLNYEKIKESANKFEVISSDNDPYVPIAKEEILRDKLGAELTILHDHGHL
ncbi:MAG TPA: alpha/beta hydrolase, partial [Candidatus Nanoarchaeia archaeon]|nr:alpha/beta hydrolase [Candidatus Nanoarchaeia archaeon]